MRDSIHAEQAVCPGETTLHFVKRTPDRRNYRAQVGDGLTNERHPAITVLLNFETLTSAAAALRGRQVNTVKVVLTGRTIPDACRRMAAQRSTFTIPALHGSIPTTTAPGRRRVPLLELGAPSLASQASPSAARDDTLSPAGTHSLPVFACWLQCGTGKLTGNIALMIDFAIVVPAAQQTLFFCVRDISNSISAILETASMHSVSRFAKSVMPIK